MALNVNTVLEWENQHSPKQDLLHVFFFVKQRNAQTFVSLHFCFCSQILLPKASGETTGSHHLDPLSPSPSGTCRLPHI